MSDPDPYAERPARQWRLVIILLALMMLAHVDRQILSLLINPIKADLELTDTQISVVYGVAFALAQIAFTLPAGYLADRISRRGMIAAGAVVWSTMTMLCGQAAGFRQLVVFRAGVGFGEAVIQPCAYSMLRAAVAPERRGRAFAVFGMAGMLGSAVALLLGGALMAAIQSSGLNELPLFGRVAPWQAVLICVGLIGFPITALLFFIREPLRTHAYGPKGGVTFKEAFSYMRSRWRIYGPLFLFQIMYGMLQLSFGAWIAPMIGRVWGLSIPQVGFALGIMMLLLPPVGIWIVGHLVDKLSIKRGVIGACLVGIGITTIHGFSSAITPLAPTLQIFWVLLAVNLFVSGGPGAIGPTIIAMVTPSELMGKVAATQLVIYGLIATALGPTIVALISDHVFTGPRALASTLSLVSVVYGSLGALFLLALLSQLRRGKQTGTDDPAVMMA